MAAGLVAPSLAVDRPLVIQLTKGRGNGGDPMTGLTTRHGSTAAVDGLDLHVEGGQVSDFLGRMGPGKSTTMPMLPGLIRPTGGRA
jgi:ABC-type multidrug transport system ATPase subunit